MWSNIFAETYLVQLMSWPMWEFQKDSVIEKSLKLSKMEIFTNSKLSNLLKGKRSLESSGTYIPDIYEKAQRRFAHFF